MSLVVVVCSQSSHISYENKFVTFYKGVDNESLAGLKSVLI